MLAYPFYALMSNSIKESDLLLSSNKLLSFSSNKSSVFDYYFSFNTTTKYLFLNTKSKYNFKAKDTKAKSSSPLLTLPLKALIYLKALTSPLALNIVLRLALQPLLYKPLSALYIRL
jgi:hypothetical protein